MSSSNNDSGLGQSVKRHWRWLAALAVVALVGGVYAERKLSPASSPAPSPASQEAQAPAAPAAPQAPAGALVPPPTLDLNEPQTGAGTDTAVESLASQTIDVAARPVATLRGQGTWTEGAKTLSEAIAKVAAATDKAGLATAGRPLVVFTETNDNGFRFEAMIPIAKAPDGKAKLENGVEIGASPSGKALKFQHRGPYDDIDSTYEAITAFLDEKGLDTKNLFIEEYLTELKTGEDEGLEIDIYVFLK
ncbi:MAG: AraC family transcriptional regulator [Methylocystaceae bacterium]|nr:MAG: AraC family transcriptional regulator [Methylocystaceae bacterium]